ncbi:uncharacterized protein LOC6573992 [Drosophila mojavensis]|uniref:TELO2-interacting protein 1 homolog n=1 Tax=Drosophila mojavensis TaxID=7230 RepID=B4K8U3_DROMO|nr:uncharacterized protein LOC6573992 [Drosophila mojavensis]EDW15512.1 uncharacterized protein Dmoj_GI24874 [Drosophila mojavensis]
MSKISSVETYVTRIKPAIENFIKEPNIANMSIVEKEISEFDFGQIRIFQIQIVVPLMVKLDALTGESQELRVSLVNCLRHIISYLYLTDEKAVCSLLVVVLKQIRNANGAALMPNLTEEIKLAVVLFIKVILQRTASDVLENFYSQNTVVTIGQILLTLMEIISKEKYRKLVNSSLECLLVLFYVHDDADAGDVVLRKQIADTIFIFLPKIVTVLYETAMADDKIGETTKILALKALGRITCIMFEETSNEFLRARYDVNAFKSLFSTPPKGDNTDLLNDINIFGSKRRTLEENEERLKFLQTNLRSAQWMEVTSRRMSGIFVDTCILRAHSSVIVRRQYAEMCCLLLKRCAHSLKCNFIYLLESVVALSQDEDNDIGNMCQANLAELQTMPSCAAIFDENAEQLLDSHLNKWPRILQRCDDSEQFAELLFFKGFLRNLSANKLQVLFLLPKNLDLFVMCLLTAFDQRSSPTLLNEEYALRRIQEDTTREVKAQCAKLHWRQFKYLSSTRCINTLYDIAAILGTEPSINRLVFDVCHELIERRNSAMNESILLMTTMITSQQRIARESRLILAELFVDQLLAEEHWHLALQPDAAWRLKVEKSSAWFKDYTPGLYSSALEVRTQDCDSDDESDPVHSRVTSLDAQFNVQHICLVLDALGHCALFIGDTFDRHIFRSLHKVLLKLASSNTVVHQAATFAFVSMQVALKYAAPSHFIECSTDYLTFHLNSLLKKSPESSAAVDILTVVLQYSTRGNVPHLESIFQTICEECTKSHQTGNVHSYLRVFNAFLRHVVSWQDTIATEISDTPMHVDEDNNILNTWLNVLNKQPTDIPIDLNSVPSGEADINMPEADLDDSPAEEPSKPSLPRHIELIKEIIGQSVKFLSNSEQTQQILALECLISGVPLLKDYEDELLPLVHLLWAPLVEKFRQKDPVVLNRCFSLLHILALHTKEFIVKRSLSDVIPQLKQFLQTASNHSCTEILKASTQEYKLQLKLLQDLPTVIRSLQIEGKHLHDLLNTVASYLSQAQPKELQELAVQFYEDLSTYNGPFVYVSLLHRAHLKDYKINVNKIFNSLGFRLATPTEIDGLK